MEIVSKSETGFELILKFPYMKLKEESKLSIEEGNKILELAYKPTVDRLMLFLAYSIGMQDIEALDMLNEFMANYAKSKITNM